MAVHPLLFDPIFRPKVWGGRKLADLLGKPLPPSEPIGESWELADLPAGRSVVRGGPMQGRTLSHLVSEWGSDLTGRATLVDGGFPLLIKFLDCRQTLSVQVHPGPTMAARTGGLKHEAWYVLDADPGAVIYRGLKPGVTRDDLAAASGSDAIADLFHRVPAKPGQCYYCPSGTPHALGAGIVVAEIQTPSDVTYRLYDWGRQRPAGDAGLHVEQALEAIEWDHPPSFGMPRKHVGGLFTTVTQLVSCTAFKIEKVRFSEGLTQDIPYAEPVVWIVLDGRGVIQYDAAQKRGQSPFSRGDVVLLPAGLQKGQLQTDSDCTLLEVTLPTGAIA